MIIYIHMYFIYIYPYVLHIYPYVFYMYPDVCIYIRIYIRVYIYISPDVFLHHWIMSKDKEKKHRF